MLRGRPREESEGEGADENRQTGLLMREQKDADRGMADGISQQRGAALRPGLEPPAGEHACDVMVPSVIVWAHGVRL